MKTSAIMLGLVLLLGVSLAVTNSDAGNIEKVKLYYGTIGSNQFVWGTTGPNSPAEAWQLHSNMPSVMMDNCAAANNTHVYVVTGYDGAQSRYLYRHAIGSTTWETMAPPPIEVTNGGCGIIGDTLYYCSGYSYTIGGTIDTLQKYCISTNTWTTAPGPFTGTTYNWQPLVLVCQNKLYYISGCNQPGATNPTRNVWCYTPGAGWSQVADMNQGRVFASGFVYHDTIWVTGGIANNVGLSHSEFYDPVANVWTVNNTVFPQLPYTVWGAGSGIVGSTGFVATGVDVGFGLTDSVAYFDFGTRTWSVEEPVYLRVYRTAAVGNGDGKAVVYGGSTGGFTPTAVCQYEQLSTGNETDVGVIQVVAPASVVTPGNITPRARIKNYGTQPQSNIPVYCWIDSSGTRVYNQNVTYPGPLAPDAVADVDFSPQWRAVGGTYNVTMFTDLTGDQQRSNDTCRGTCQVMQYTIDWSQSDTIRPDRVSRTAVCTDASGNVHVICGNCYPHTSHPQDMIYDTVANTWSVGLTHPAGTYGVHNHDAVRIGDVIWCGGGSSGSGFYNNMTKLDLGAGTWTAAAAMPQSNLLYYALEEYADSGWVYCFGGSPSGTSGPLNTCYRYTTATNQWTQMANMPDVRRNPMTARVGDTIYVIGGMQANDYTSTRGTVWKYSVLGNTWTVATDTMPDALGWGKAVTYNYGTFGTFIYVFGGYRRGTVVNACWRYDPIAHTWNADRPLLTGTRSFGADISGNYIWAAGGWNNDILPNVQKGIIAIVGIEEGKPSINWVSGFERIAPTIVRDLARISYYVPARGNVNLSVYDAAGKLVRTLVNGASEPGTKTVTWDRRNELGSRVANGTYFYRLTIDGTAVSAKAVVLE